VKNPGNVPVAGAAEALTQENDGKQVKATLFGYAAPTELQKDKAIVRLCRSDIIYSSVQVLKEGGENNLHAHSAQDGVWIVLKGRARFYGKDNVLLAELGPMQGVHIPRGFYYWFERAGTEVLELLQTEAIDKTIVNRRLDATPSKDLAKDIQHI
jgi:mannose-6-phosphate isomerase-like protein (cupin superfamily)